LDSSVKKLEEDVIWFDSHTGDMFRMQLLEYALPQAIQTIRRDQTGCSNIYTNLFIAISHLYVNTLPVLLIH
jgi:hypothetical protein